MDVQARILREIAERVGAAPVRQIAAQAGVKAVYRVTVHHPGGRACDALATVTNSLATGRQVAALYRGRFDHKPITRPMPEIAYAGFSAAFSGKAFDSLRDQDDLPLYDADLCMVERAAGTFVKSVIFAPQEAPASYARLWEAIRAYLPEATREVEP